MSKPTLAVAVVGVIIVLGGGAFILDASIQDSQVAREAVNESFDPVGGDVVELENSHITRAEYDDTVTVRDANESELQASGNYTWNQGNGTLTVVDNSYLDNQTTAYVTYGWYGQSVTQDRSTDVILKFPQLFPIVALGGLMFFALAVSLGVLTNL